MSGSTHVTNGGSGEMMSNAELELPYPRVSKAKFPDESSQRGSNICDALICNIASISNIIHLW